MNLLLNPFADFNLTSQGCYFHEPLPKMFRLLRSVAKITPEQKIRKNLDDISSLNTGLFFLALQPISIIYLLRVSCRSKYYLVLRQCTPRLREAIHLKGI